MSLKELHTIINTCNAPDNTNVSWFGKWLIIIRACVFSMTMTSTVIGVFLGLRDGHSAWGLALLVMVGLLCAHAANNVLNDLMDYRSGVDSPDYFRVQYSPHPIHAGWLTARGLFLAFLFFSLIDFIIMLVFIQVVDIGVLFFALAGFLISVCYVGGTYSLKFTGLGELAVFLVWGPLMIGGTYYVITGDINTPVFLASIPYGLVVTTVIMGKHIDKLEKDKAKGIRTLPVILGVSGALHLIKALIIAFYLVIISLSLFNIIPYASLVTLLSLKRAVQVWKKLSEPKPDKAPLGWPIWPLWYVGWCFHLVKLAGGLFILGMICEILIRHFF